MVILQGGIICTLVATMDSFAINGKPCTTPAHFKYSICGQS